MTGLVARLASLLALAPIIALPLEAQSLDSLAPGTRVRVTGHGLAHVFAGNLVRADSVSLLVTPDRGRVPMTVSLSDVRRVDVSYGKRSSGEAFARGAKTGAFIGIGVGIVATGLAMYADHRHPCNGCYFTNTTIAIPLSALFSGATTLVGGAIGLARRDKWSRAWPPR